MLRLGLYSVALLLSVVMVSPASAATIDYGVFPGGQVGGNPGWQGVTVNGSGDITTAAYWNNLSTDSPNFGHTIGNYMIGGETTDAFGGTGLSFSPADVQWWGNASGLSADPNIAFSTATAGGFVGTNLRLEVAGFSASNTFGYYLTSAPGALIELYDGAATTGAVNFFLPVGDFGFYLTSNGNIFRSDATGQTGEFDGNQHFTAFRDTAFAGAERAIWIGVEDLAFGGADRDYQDMIVRIDAVPEPATLLLVGSSLLALGFAGARARRRS
jgi:hypothetical protein